MDRQTKPELMLIVDIDRPHRVAISLTEIPRRSINLPSTEPKGCRSGTPAGAEPDPMTTSPTFATNRISRRRCAATSLRAVPPSLDTGQHSLVRGDHGGVQVLNERPHGAAVTVKQPQERLRTIRVVQCDGPGPPIVSLPSPKVGDRGCHGRGPHVCIRAAA
ncbi:hypothetical protein Pth03_57060 [Planotetraspora thailandica]|uniref:Uncharacterized protein n=1 Tax=Planotetraspora thailandica TaxID=487172 RepID=A0A8J3V4M9_9ACTN|nr:hypothetical protein [Planotetraspora thailandica]GII57317.1 hypothetical protein Pth03_57060 [Planotetraspora thailandica]